MLKKLRDVEQLPEPEALEFLALPSLVEEDDGEDQLRWKTRPQ